MSVMGLSPAARKIGDRRRYIRALVVALLTLASLTCPWREAAAQGRGPTMTVAAGFDGYCRSEAWCPVYVLLTNEGADVEGELGLIPRYAGRSDEPTCAKPVLLPAHSRKAFHLYIPPEAQSTRWTVRLSSGEEILVEQEFSFRYVGEADRLYGVVGGTGSTLNILTDVAPPHGRAVVAHLSLEGLPPDPLSWEGMDVVVLDDVDTSALTTAQHEALETWVAHGGHLIVGGGGGAARTAAGIADLLPVTVGATQSVDDLWALEERLGLPLAPGPFALAEATLQAGEILLDQEGLILLARRPYGAGLVDFMAFDAGAGLFDRWEDTVRLWSLLIETAAPSRWRLAVRPQGGYSAQEAVNAVPGLTAPTALQMLAFMLAYTLLVGPINYLLLRKMDRRELAWLTIPLLILVFTACAYLTGFQIRGRTPIVHRLSAIQVPPRGRTGRVLALVGLFSPRRATYDVQVTGAQVREAQWELYYDVPTARFSRIFQEAEGSRVAGVRVDVGGIRPFIAEGYVDVPPVEADLRLVPGEGDRLRLEGTVRNGSMRLEEAVLIVGYEEQRLGDLEPGMEVPIHLDLYASVRIPPGGPPTFVGPYTGRGLPEQILGPEDYWSDRDLYRRYQFLQALFPYNGPGLGPGVYLVGWAEEALPSVEVVDRPVRQRGVSLYLYELEVASVEADVSFTIPPSLVFCSPEEEEGGYDPYRPPYATVVFRCVPWAGGAMERVDEVTLHLRGEGTVEVSLWNWDRGEWEEIGEGWGRFSLTDPESAVSPAGDLRLRLKGGSDPMMIERIEVTMKGQR